MENNMDIVHSAGTSEEQLLPGIELHGFLEILYGNPDIIYLSPQCCYSFVLLFNF